MGMIQNYTSRTLAYVLGVDSNNNVGKEVVRRKPLTAETTYYVRDTGNDNNDGSSGFPFLTVQKAIDVINSIDHDIFSVIIDLGGTAWTGGPYVIGNTVHSNSSIIGVIGAGSSLTSISLWARYTSTVYISGLAIDANLGDGFAGIQAGEHAEIISGPDVLFKTNLPGATDIYCYDEGAFSADDNFSISGNKATFFDGDFTGRFHHLHNANVVTCVGTPVFSGAFLNLRDHMQVDWGAATSSGAATGPKYLVTGSKAGITGTIANIPGSTAGTHAVDAVDVLSTSKEIDSVGVPNTQTGATYTVLAADRSIIANRAGTVTLTLLDAASYPGRQLLVKTIQAQTVVSATSNVVPLAGGSAGTAILVATVGKWAILQSDGTNWVIMASN